MLRSNLQVYPEPDIVYREDLEIVSMSLFNDTVLSMLEGPLFLTLQK